MKRIQLLFVLLFGFSLLSACGKRGLETDDFNASKTGFLIAAGDGSYYRADCLAKAGDVPLNSASAAQCKWNDSTRQALSLSFQIINNDFAMYFCQQAFPRYASNCLNFFGLNYYQPQPTYRTCNTCVSCPFGGLCPQYCFTSCSNPYPRPYPQPQPWPQPYPTPYPNPWPYPTPTPTPTTLPNPSCGPMKAQIESYAQSRAFCSSNADCTLLPRLATSCQDIQVNRYYANDPMLSQQIANYNSMCRPTAPMMCPMIATLPTCVNNRCGGWTY